MSHDCLGKPCILCGTRITGANGYCPKCKICVCFGCGVKIALAEHEAPPSCPSCGSKLT